MSLPRRNAALWASVLPWMAGCLTDLAVGWSEIEREEPATVVDAGDDDVRDGAAFEAGARDASDLDARSRDAASCREDPCPSPAGDSAPDGAVARDASPPRDAASRDAATRDAAVGDAGADAGEEECIPSDCEYVGLVVTFQSCERGSEPVCMRTDKGICDLVCRSVPIDLRADDAATKGEPASSRIRDGGRESLDDAAAAGSGPAAQPADGAVPAQDGAMMTGGGGEPALGARDD